MDKLVIVIDSPGDPFSFIEIANVLLDYANQRLDALEAELEDLEKD